MKREKIFNIIVVILALSLWPVISVILCKFWDVSSKTSIYLGGGIFFAGGYGLIFIIENIIKKTPSLQEKKALSRTSKKTKDNSLKETAAIPSTDVKSVLLDQLEDILANGYENYEEYISWNKTLSTYGFLDDDGKIKPEHKKEYIEIIKEPTCKMLDDLLAEGEINPLENQWRYENALVDFHDESYSQEQKEVILDWWEIDHIKKRTSKVKPSEEKEVATSIKKTSCKKNVTLEKAKEVEQVLKGDKKTILKLFQENTPTLLFVALFGTGFKKNFPFYSGVLVQYLKENPGKVTVVANSIASLSTSKDEKLSATDWMGSMSLGWMIGTFGDWYKEYTKKNIGAAFKKENRVEIEFANTIAKRKSPLYVSFDGKTARLVEYVGHHSGDTVKISELNIISTDVIKKAKGKVQTIPVKKEWGEYQNKNKIIDVGEVFNPKVKVE